MAATIFFQYRRHVTLTAVVRPLVLYFPLFFLLLSLSNLLQAEAFRPLLGITLIILSLYFILFPNSLTIKPTLANTFICVFFNALIDAFFGIGAPFIAIYFLSLSQSKEAYIGTLQAYCMFSMIYAVSVRYIDKQYTLDMAPYFLLGLLALNLGIVLGNKVMKHLTIHHLKKIVYLFIGVAGILSLLAS